MDLNHTFIHFVPVLALVLDILIGDPRWLPHPVVGLGRLAAWWERLARRMPASGTNAGAFLAGALGMVLLAGGAGWAAWRLSGLGYAGPLLALYLSWSGLALGGLLREAHAAFRAVETGSIGEGRAAVAMLVSRDTTALDAPSLRKALAETLAENLNDGLVAPFFYLVLLGPGGLWAYKAVSTLDSMWGYRTPEYAWFGKAAARMDDVLAFIPARLTALGMVLAAALAGPVGPSFGSIARIVRGVRRDARKTSSPNAGWPMAAAAWIFGATMGGDAIYFGAWVPKPVLGPAEGHVELSAEGPGKEWTRERFVGLLRLCFMAGVGTCLAMYLAGMLIRGEI
ncbi:adenosylcobinamide-phosphate synthase CbiB [Oceanidesulfovibrio marinus]|uniref:Cobalamin biosynthesis protein CobD n=1 Tax=Oceanidesulfovibrio marinus TaxID=370038 RepID=A0A6P1ZMM4_9BACT|nr:adenosylcobinamide-phosphate synthase CbiB [Oceanidesulfovibrio marinus]TVM36770.1 cobalamin biosynthesis protein CobD [Oceanidesulfovibrio marinus]